MERRAGDSLIRFVLFLCRTWTPLALRKLFDEGILFGFEAILDRISL